MRLAEVAGFDQTFCSLCLVVHVDDEEARDSLLVGKGEMIWLRLYKFLASKIAAFAIDEKEIVIMFSKLFGINRTEFGNGSLLVRHYWSFRYKVIKLLILKEGRPLSPYFSPKKPEISHPAVR